MLNNVLFLFCAVLFMFWFFFFMTRFTCCCFCCLLLQCFCVVAAAGFAFPPPSFPRIYLVIKHFIFQITWYFCFLLCCSRTGYFLWQIYMLLFLLIVVTVFCVLLFRLVSCVPCSFFCVVFLLWPQMHRTLVMFICLWHFCFVCVFSCWIVVLLFGLLFSCCCRPWQISSPRALSAPICLVYLPPHIKLAHSVHPHHWWAYMHL